MWKKNGVAAKRNAGEEAARKLRFKEARSRSMLRVGINIANSLSVIAEVLAAKHNVSSRWFLADS
jgi:hypothetical protein